MGDALAVAFERVIWTRCDAVPPRINSAPTAAACARTAHSVGGNLAFADADVVVLPSVNVVDAEPIRKRAGRTRCGAAAVGCLELAVCASVAAAVRAAPAEACSRAAVSVGPTVFATRGRARSIAARGRERDRGPIHGDAVAAANHLSQRNNCTGIAGAGGGDDRNEKVGHY